MPRLGLSVLALALAASAPAQEKVTRADLKPGLVFTATDSGPAPFTVSRVEQTVGLTLAAGEAPHPRSYGGWRFRWEGYLNVLQPGTYRFDAVLLGRLKVTVGDKTVFDGSAPADDPKAGKLVVGPEVELPAGVQPFVAEFGRTGMTSAARVELIWKGPGFRAEPVPYFFFGHLPRQRPATFQADLAREHGRLLFEELSCVRCHQPTAGDHVAKTLVERTGPNLTDVGRRVNPGWLDAWLADPHKLRPDTAMPRLFADDEAGRAERYAVAAYLASLGGPPAEFRYTSNPGQYQRNVSDGQRLYLTAGCAACHGEQVTRRPAKKKPADDEDEKPEANPEDSAYAAGTAGPRGFYLLGAVGSKFTPESLARYLQNPLANNPHGRMPNMVLSADEARNLAWFLCRQTDDAVGRDLPDAPKRMPAVSGSIVERWRFARLKRADQWKDLGKRLVVSKGCVNCHAVEPGGKPLPPAKAPSLAAVRKAPASGCLSEAPSVRMVPVYSLDAGQRSALTAFLRDGLGGPGSPAPAYQARLALKRFNCLNCHYRDGEGGIPPELADRMRLLEKAENADDVSPPRLTGVGHKLRTSWMRQVLTEAGRARPWMTLRMPQYGNPNVEFLADALPKLEGTTADDAVGRVALTPAKVEAGRALAGKAGHGCISCHDISGVSGGGTRGPDLARTHERVRFDWYTRWMHQPQRLAPGTRMPQAFLDGKSLLTSVFDGDGDRQIEALWAYFSLGPGLPLPAGMDPPKGVIVAVRDRPEVLRTFMPDGAGSKAVAVGYPGGVNVVFDAAQCRLSYAWSGNFLDASPVWTNRGGAPAKLLGPKFWESPKGFPWAVTESRTPPDFARRAEDPAYGHPLPDDRFYGGPRRVHFGGYALDAAGLPTFRYALADEYGRTELTVAERPEPLPVSVAAGVRRTFTVERPAGKTTWLLAGVAAREPWVVRPDGGKLGDGGEVPAAAGRVLVPGDGDRATVLEATAAPDGAAWRLVRQTGGWVVLLRLPEATATRKDEVRILIWGLPRGDEALVKGLKGS